MMLFTVAVACDLMLIAKKNNKKNLSQSEVLRSAVYSSSYPSLLTSVIAPPFSLLSCFKDDVSFGANSNYLFFFF